MNSWIETICIHYDESNKKEALFLRLFFQMIGVYVYEEDISFSDMPYTSSTGCFADIVLVNSQNYKTVMKNRTERQILLFINTYSTDGTPDFTVEDSFYDPLVILADFDQVPQIS